MKKLEIEKIENGYLLEAKQEMKLVNDPCWKKYYFETMQELISFMDDYFNRKEN